MHRHHIHFKLLFIQLITIIPFLIFIFYLFDLWMDTQRKFVIDENIHTTQLISNSINNSFMVTMKVSKILATNDTFIPQISEHPDSALATMKNIIVNMEEIDSIGVADKNGTVLLSTIDNPITSNTVNISDRDYFKKVVETRQPVFSEPIIGRNSGKRVIIAAAPIIRDGEIKFVIFSGYNIGYLKNKIEKSLNNDPNTESIIVLDQNEKLVFILNQPEPTDTEIAAYKNLKSITLPESDRVVIIENQKLSLSNKPFTGAIASVKDIGWFVISTDSINDIFAPHLKLQRLIWIIIGLGLLFSISFVTYALRKVKIIY